MEKPGQSSRDDEGSVVGHPVGLVERESQNRQQGGQRLLQGHRGDAESQDDSSDEGENHKQKENFKSLFKSLKKFPRCQYRLTLSLAYDGHDIGQLKTKSVGFNGSCYLDDIRCHKFAGYLPEQCLMCNGYSRHHRSCPMSK